MHRRRKQNLNNIMIKKGLTFLVTGIFAIMAASMLFIACSDSNKNARLEVRLTDAPGDYDEVNVDIQGVQVHSESGGWRSLEIESGVYNLLELTNGLDVLLGAVELPAGRVSQIRLILGDNNTLKIGEETFDLATPSAQQSGLKLNVQANLTEGITYTILLDFDAARSIVETGNGSYILKPVIRAISQATSGAIKGSVSIPESSPAVYAIVGTDTVGTSFADETGKFLIKGVPAGTYKVTFSPATGYTISDISDVAVTVGNVTDLGVVTVNQ
jgi:hypothetical protein